MCWSSATLTQGQLWVLYPPPAETQCKIWSATFDHHCPDSLPPTSGEDHVPGDELVVDYRELWKLDPGHPGNSRVSPFPVELYVVCGVPVYEEKPGARCDSHEVDGQNESVSWLTEMKMAACDL